MATLLTFSHFSNWPGKGRFKKKSNDAVFGLHRPTKMKGILSPHKHFKSGSRSFNFTAQTTITKLTTKFATF